MRVDQRGNRDTLDACVLLPGSVCTLADPLPSVLRTACVSLQRSSPAVVVVPLLALRTAAVVAAVVAAVAAGNDAAGTAVAAAGTPAVVVVGRGHPMATAFPAARNAAVRGLAAALAR